MKILIVESEPDLLRGMMSYLKSENFICEEAKGYVLARQRLGLYNYDCVVLDVALFDGDGLRLLKEIKEIRPATGIILLSSRNSPVDRIEGLNLGADDFLTKPFHLSELNARIASVIRRRHFNGLQVITIGDLSLDLMGRTVEVGGKGVDLTRKEYDLLLYLAYNRNRVVSKAAIAEHLLGDQLDGVGGFDFIYSHIKNIKKKLQEAGGSVLIKTIYGSGYQLVEK